MNRSMSLFITLITTTLFRCLTLEREFATLKNEHGIQSHSNFPPLRRGFLGTAAVRV